ncbi:hypothetical protein SYNTR_0759 [Candidatus Syntrophocurvum alkaliphilum]|uniref:Rod shape-determining protein MreD n=1 Tax=Candidatus Syntrophocurvum alkaliphilum TaxID=2293317 RepID=A0A6I6DE95_9FIRM|nr:CBO0543 family protein [Candidatus Syntrophocurvum alkaliphilum]QGT99352.1 hypothetical protein SYNTR_0759 [Candidatus Syntrophocurvum alkaliphilum]
MLLNIIIGFIIPWIIATPLFLKFKKNVLLIAPFAAMISLLFNVIGIQLGWWLIQPFKYEVIATIPIDLGLYPVMAIYLTVLFEKIKGRYLLLVLLFTLLTTFLEFIAVIFDYVLYSNGWNIGYTFISYLIPYFLVYLYYIKYVKKLSFTYNEL